MFELWMQVESFDGVVIDKYVGEIEGYMRAHAVARNLINITGNNVWVEEI